MPKNGTVVGIDSSTQSCKVLVVDAASGEVISRGSSPHPDGTSVDPRAWIEALNIAWDFAGVRQRTDVIGVGVSAQQHGMVALDASGQPVYDALLWNDVRSAPQAQAMVEKLSVQGWVDAVGTAPVSSITLTKLAWLRQQEPETADKLVSVGLPHDWILRHLTGGQWVTDRSDASGTGWFDPATNTVREDFLEQWFGRVPHLPTVLDPHHCAGNVAAQWLPHSPKAVVSAGCGDNAGAALGLGVEPGDVVVSVGTSGTVFARSARPAPDPTGVTSGFADATGQFLPLLCTLNAARVMARTAALLGLPVDHLDALAADGAADCGGLTLLPYLDGERTPNLPEATGRWHGITGESLTRENMARSAIMGVANSLADCLDVLRTLNVPVNRALLIGGGARSSQLRTALSHVLGVDIDVPAPDEYVALGAARQAAWAALGELPTWQAGAEGSQHIPHTHDDGATAYRQTYRTMRRQLESETNS
ncbi:MAG: xylulokinase [Kocuria sp.]|nr:xylulokinase [Kocuria sp.]